jgi:PncC family amidohydrolase
MLLTSLVLAVASSGTARAETTTFSYTGSEQTFTVPAGVTTLQITATGGAGGSGGTSEAEPTPAPGGVAATASDTVSVTPGATYTAEVGGAGLASGTKINGGFNGGGSSAPGFGGGGGGGGASDVCRTPLHSVIEPTACLIVAGGGGGGGGNGSIKWPAGAGGNAGQAGMHGETATSSYAGAGGEPGSASAGGAGGSGGKDELSGATGASGQLGIGGGQVASLLRGDGDAQTHTIAVAESCTGGLLLARLTCPPGASQYVLGGVVAYSNEAKIAQVRVPRETIEAHGAVSEEVARALADGARTRLGADVGVGLTGIAGPGGGSEDKPVGLVWLSVAGPDGADITRSVRLPGGRADVRERAALVAMHLIRRLLH